MSSKEDHDFLMSLPYNAVKGCPKGYHKRAEYKTRKGRTVPARCVRSTTHHEESSKDFKRRQALKMTRRIRLHVPTIKTLTRGACPPGMIPRKAYVRKYTSKVKEQGFTVRKKGAKTYRIFPTKKEMFVESRCVKDLGLPGKGTKSGKTIGPLHKGELAKYGYSYADPEAQRHAALKKSVDAYGALGVYRKLDAVAKLTMRTVPHVSKAFKRDRDWVKAKFGPLKAF